VIEELQLQGFRPNSSSDVPRVRALHLVFVIVFTGILSTFSAVAGEVRIEGLQGDMLKNAKQYVELYQRKDDEKLSDRWRKTLHEDAPDQIRESLHPFGYYNAEVEGKMTGNAGKWTAVYRVDPGKPVKVSEVNIRWQGAGADRPELQKALDKFPLKPDDVFVHEVYEDGKAALQDVAYELGFVKVKPVQHVVRVNPEQNTAAIQLVLNTGPWYHFGKITLHQEVIAPELLQKFVDLKEGQPYSNRDLIQFQQRLTSSGWFSVVEVKPDFDQAQDAVVPIDVYFTPSKKHKLEFGLGFATDVGVRGSVRWTNNRVNRLGHQAGASLKLAPVKGTVNANYQIPVRNPRTDRLSFSTTYEYEDINDTDRDTVNLETAFLRTTLDGKNFFKLFGEFRYEKFTAGEEEDVTTKLLSPGGIVRRTVAEKAEFIRQGYSVSADVRVASSALVSDTSFLRGDFNAVYLYPLGSRGRLKLRGQIGLAWVEDFDNYPNSLRFFAGGDQSVRGYDYNDLGPTDDSGAVIGGKNLLVGSLEYERRIVGKWVGAAFVDAGNAYDDTLDKVFVGAGVGVRWLAPFGSVRVDFAWPVSENPTFNDIQFHLGFGAVL